MHEIIGSFIRGKDVGNLSLGSRWCLKTFVEEGESNVTINSFPDKALMPEVHSAVYEGDWRNYAWASRMIAVWQG